MGLADRKVKQKIGNDPRNLTWSTDQSRFSYQHLQKFGWDPSKGLGASGEGNPNHIAVVKKADAGGIGVARAIKEGGEVGGAGEGLDALLKRLKSAGSGGGPIVFGDDGEEETKEGDGDGETDGQVVVQVEQTVVPTQAAPAPLRIMASRAKYQKAKRLAASSPAAMAEILGVPLSSLPASPSPLSISLAASPSGSPAPQAPAPVPGAGLGSASGTSTPAPMGLGFRPPAAQEFTPASGTSTPDVTDRTADSMLTTSTLSLGEYFRQKMLRKRLEREGAVVPGQEVDLAVLDRAGRNSEVAKEFEGKRVVFGDAEAGVGAADVELVVKPTIKADKKSKSKKRKAVEVDAEAEGDASGALAEVDAMLPAQAVAGPSRLGDAATTAEAPAAKKSKKSKKAKQAPAADPTPLLVSRWSPSEPAAQPALAADYTVPAALHTPTSERLAADAEATRRAEKQARKEAQRGDKAARRALKREGAAGVIQGAGEKSHADKDRKREANTARKAARKAGAETGSDPAKPSKKSKKDKLSNA